MHFVYLFVCFTVKGIVLQKNVYIYNMLCRTAVQCTLYSLMELHRIMRIRETVFTLRASPV
jgi:hypothetical protein